MAEDHVQPATTNECNGLRGFGLHGLHDALSDGLWEEFPCAEINSRCFAASPTARVSVTACDRRRT